MIKKIISRHVPDISCALGDRLHPLLQRIYLSRGVNTPIELDCTLGRLLPAQGLKGIDNAVDIITRAIIANSKIMVVADFDCDGATSCTVAVRGLRAMGAGPVNYLVPNRFEYGYGLTPEIVEVAAGYRPDVLITVDNGISSIQGVANAKKLGMQVVITDHHLQGEGLPDADAIVNPNQKGDSFKSKNLAGVGVIFYVLLACRARLRDQGWFAKKEMDEPNLAQLLDLVALGTIADLVPLDYNNRILVEQGLRRIRGGHACVGMNALLEVSGRGIDRVIASDMGFAVAPRLNAAGRLEDMSVGIECLLSDSSRAAGELAVSLDNLNQERKLIESDMRDEAFLELEKIKLDNNGGDIPVAVCLYDEQWHQGVIGILASRIKERFHRPVIIFAKGDDGEIKGSARSIQGVHIRDVLDAITKKYDGLIIKFGGHAMAAGLTIALDDIDKFTRAYTEEICRWVGEEGLQHCIHTDGELGMEEFNLELAELLRVAGPWGQGFPEPLFEGDFRVIHQRIVGKRHLKMILQPLESSMNIDAIAFNAADNEIPREGDQRRFVYKLDVNEYRGQKKLQLMVEYIEMA
ncbi:MAG TPA: single-stranded-DNA-specific exonuclease RecJ [Gammaproteobacteria bacterium]|nr:single-stranded-DNA-specific exonuclease RecJ [Gammaproteobacteria bacterium]